MSDRNKAVSTRMVLLLLLATTAIVAMAMMTSIPSVAFGADSIDPDSYVSGFMSSNGLGASDSNTMLQQNGFQTYNGGDVLPGFDDIGATMTGLILGFVPVLFIVKFAGRAMLGITHSGRDEMDIPNFFKTANERRKGPSGGAKDGTSWYVDMGKDFLRYFGVAVAVWLVFAAIIAVVNLVMSNAPGSDMNGNTFIDQLNHGA